MQCRISPTTQKMLPLLLLCQAAVGQLVSVQRSRPTGACLTLASEPGNCRPEQRCPAVMQGRSDTISKDNQQSVSLVLLDTFPLCVLCQTHHVLEFAAETPPPAEPPRPLQPLLLLPPLHHGPHLGQ